MKHKFKFEGLLKLRKFKEHKGKVQLAQVNKEILNSKEKMARAEQDIRSAYKMAELALQDGKNGRVLPFYPAYIQSRRNDIKKERYHLKKLEQEFQKKTQTLSVLRGNLKVIEKLKIKDFEKFKRKYQKKIQDDIDDILMAARVGKSGGGPGGNL